MRLTHRKFNLRSTSSTSPIRNTGILISILPMRGNNTLTFHAQRQCVLAATPLMPPPRSGPPVQLRGKLILLMHAISIDKSSTNPLARCQASFSPCLTAPATATADRTLVCCDSAPSAYQTHSHNPNKLNCCPRECPAPWGLASNTLLQPRCR